VNSALILHTFASRFFHIKVISGGSFDVNCGMLRALQALLALNSMTGQHLTLRVKPTLIGMSSETKKN